MLSAAYVDHPSQQKLATVALLQHAPVVLNKPPDSLSGVGGASSDGHEYRGQVLRPHFVLEVETNETKFSLMQQHTAYISTDVILYYMLTQ